MVILNEQSDTNGNVEKSSSSTSTASASLEENTTRRQSIGVENTSVIDLAADSSTSTRSSAADLVDETPLNDATTCESEQVAQLSTPVVTTAVVASEDALALKIPRIVSVSSGGGVKRKSTENSSTIESINERTSRLGLQTAVESASSAPQSPSVSSMSSSSPSPPSTVDCSSYSSNNMSAVVASTTTTTTTTPNVPLSMSSTREKRIRKQKAYDDDFLMFSPLPSWQANHNLARADSNGFLIFVI